MKKTLKLKDLLSDKVKITYIVDEKLNRLKGKNHAPKKLEEINELLRKCKNSLPE